MRLKYICGDLFDHDLGGSVVPHVVNSKGVWGSGFVVPLGQKYPQAREAYLAWSQGSPPNARYPGGVEFSLGRTQIVETAGPLVANMLAQNGVGGVRPLRYNALAACMDQVAAEARGRGAKVVAPMFGSALAGGDWRFIRQLIDDTWGDLDVTIYYRPDNVPEDL